MGTLLTDEGVDAQGPDRNGGAARCGASIVLAEHYLISELPTGGTDECPADTDHIIKTTWRGRLRPGGADLDESHRLGTTVEYANGEVRVAAPCGRLRQRQSRGVVCVAPGEAVAITAGAGLYEDPNGDPNELHTQVVMDAQDVTPRAL